jgi:hypothetical protein
MPKQKHKTKKATKTKTMKPAATVDDPKKTSSVKLPGSTW